MCGLAHSTTFTVPVKVIGLFWSNSAVTAWCAETSAGSNISTPAATTVRTFRDIDRVSWDVSVLVIGRLPRLDRAVGQVLEVVLLARVLHDHVRIRLDPPGAHVHPVLRVRLRVV